MERESILKYTRIFCGYLIIIIGIMEIANFIILSLTQVNIPNNFPLFIFIIFNWNISRITLSFLWLSQLVFSIFLFLVGIYIVRFTNKVKLEDLTLAKYILIFGFFFLIFMIIKAELLFMISQSYVNIDSELLSIHNLINYEGYVPFYGLLLWVFYMMSISYLSVLGMSIGGVGLSWILEIEKKNEDKSKI